MSFSDLPTGWAERPVTDPDIFDDAVDLIATDDSRRSGSLYILICDGSGRMFQPLVFDGSIYDESSPVQEAYLDSLCGILTQVGCRDVVLVIARRGHPAPSGNDHQFRAVAEKAFARHEIAILGMSIATPAGVRGWLPESPGARRSA